MKLKEIQLDNFSSFKKQKIEFKDITFLIGANGVGKSKILQSLKLINSYILNKPQMFPFVEYVYNKNERLQVRLLFDFELSNEERNNLLDFIFGISNDHIQNVLNTNFCKTIRYRVDLTKDGIKNEIIRIRNFESGLLTVISKQLAPENHLNNDHISLVEKLSSIKELVNFEYKGIRVGNSARNYQSILYILPQFDPAEQFLGNLLRDYFSGIVWYEPYRSLVTPNLAMNEKELNAEGSNIIPVLRNISADDSWEYVRVSRYIRQTVPNIEKNSSPMEEGNPTLKFHERGLDTPLDLINMSTGTQQITTLITGINTVGNHKLVLIEEPEAHVHASAQRKMLDLIRSKENLQFIITTHSTIFTGCDDICSTILLGKKDGLTYVKSVDYNEFQLVRKMLGHRNADLFYDECVVFVEGESEDIFYPILFDHLGYDLKNLGIKIINVKGKDNFLKIEKTLEYLKNTDIITYIIADGNRKLSNKIPEWEKNELIKTGSSTIWEKEFEDIFELGEIVSAFNMWLKNRDIENEVNIDYIVENQTSNMSVVKVLDKFLYENNLIRLDKPALSEILAEKIISSNTNSQILSSKYGSCISKIIDMINLKNETTQDIF